jgi:hypothetical protein
MQASVAALQGRPLYLLDWQRPKGDQLLRLPLMKMAAHGLRTPACSEMHSDVSELCPCPAQASHIAVPAFSRLFGSPRLLTHCTENLYNYCSNDACCRTFLAWPGRLQAHVVPCPRCQHYRRRSHQRAALALHPRLGQRLGQRLPGADGWTRPSTSHNPTTQLANKVTDQRSSPMT